MAGVTMIGGYLSELYEKPDEIMKKANLGEREVMLIKMVLGLGEDGIVKTKGEIAKVFGISVSSVGTRYEKAMYKLKRKMLEEKYEGYWEPDAPVTVSTKHYLWKNTIYLQIDLEDNANPNLIKEQLMPILKSKEVKEWKWESK